MLEFHAIPWDHVPWDELDRFADRTVYQTREWLEFIVETQHGTPVVAELRQEGALAGYFSGLLIRKLGLKILGSPFPGWTTSYIGFNLLPDTVSRSHALDGLRRWAFGTIGCSHLEVSDLQFWNEGTPAGQLERQASPSYESDLTRTEEEILSRMRKSCRWSIRKAEKSGVTVEEAVAAGFADEYYAQLLDVFARQGLKPTYSVERVRALVRCLHPTGRLLLLRVRNPEGRSIATGIYPGFNQWAHFWGTASFRIEQHWQPNEGLHWYAMRYWKRRGVRHFDWGGAGERSFKEKFGGAPLAIPSFYGSKYRALSVIRNGARELYYGGRKMIGRVWGFRYQPPALSGE